MNECDDIAESTRAIPEYPGVGKSVILPHLECGDRQFESGRPDHPTATKLAKTLSLHRLGVMVARRPPNPKA